MTTETIDAIFEHGTFRLVRPPTIPLRDGQRVRLVVEIEESPDAILALAASVYAGLSPQDITEVEQIALQRRDFFGSKSPWHSTARAIYPSSKASAKL
jgi:predicted DNA-binding antitoxin AbrB/MazE fold protein